MSDLFDLGTVKAHLRVDRDAEDMLITRYMEAAEGFCESFLGRSLDTFEVLPGTVLAGLLIHTSMLYESREGEFIEKNLAVVRLLYWPHRVVPI